MIEGEPTGQTGMEDDALASQQEGDSSVDDSDDGVALVDTSEEASIDTPLRMSKARSMELSRVAASNEIAARKQAREAERVRANGERSQKWGDRWNRFKGAVKNAWDGTKAFIKEVPNAKSHALDLGDKLYDYSADKVNGLAVRTVKKVNQVTTNWGDEMTAAGNFLATAGTVLRSSYAKERMSATVETGMKLVDNLQDETVDSDTDAEEVIEKQADKVTRLRAELEVAQLELQIARAKSSKLKAGGEWLRGFLS